MPKMMMPDTMVAIAANGGGLDIDCSVQMVMPDTMKAIATAAARSGKKPTITFRNVEILMPDTAKQVAALGEGCVVFTIP